MSHQRKKTKNKNTREEEFCCSNIDKSLNLSQVFTLDIRFELELNMNSNLN